MTSQRSSKIGKPEAVKEHVKTQRNRKDNVVEETPNYGTIQ